MAYNCEAEIKRLEAKNTELEQKLAESVPFETMCWNCKHFEWDGGGVSCEKGGDETIGNCPIVKGEK